MSAALIWCPFADEGSAELVAARLLEEGLIACVNILPAVRSLYLWEGGKHEAAEVGALFKTHATLLDRAVARLVELHPYEAPSVIGWRADAAAPPTAEHGKFAGRPRAGRLSSPLPVDMIVALLTTDQMCRMPPDSSVLAPR